MSKFFHEVRDPIHIFIKYDSYERDVINSLPFQRLRHIHQLGMTYLLYPGATHRRFEHSLGVMELAGRVYDILIKRPHSKIKNIVPETPDEKNYWRRVIRMAGLCHDLGHLPFSHTAETLLPDGWNHEKLTIEIIKSKEMCQIWKSMKPPLNEDDIVKLSVGPKIFKETTFNDWEALLSESITSNAFGVDRIDYLLRDSHHAGVLYGKFDHIRLIDTLRLLPKSNKSLEPMIGIESGGIHTAEALLLARYFMFIQVYLHHVRRIYDIHLQDFLINWLEEGKFKTNLNSFLGITDNEVLAALSSFCKDKNSKPYEYAKRIVFRNHFKILYERIPEDLQLHPEPGRAIHEAAMIKFGDTNVRHDPYYKGSGEIDFPVLCNDGRILSSLAISKPLSNIPHAAIDYVFIDPALRDDGKKWLEKNRTNILKQSSIAEREEE